MSIFSRWFSSSGAGIPSAVAADPDFRFLQSNALLTDLTVAAQLFLFSRVVKRRYSRREMIFRDQNPGICMFVIRKGEVELFVEQHDGRQLQLANLAEGELFGEIATASGYHRTASARASKSDTLLWSISRFDLEDLNKRYPSDGLMVQRGITLSVIDSLIATTAQLRQSQQTVENLRVQLSRYEKQ